MKIVWTMSNFMNNREMIKVPIKKCQTSTFKNYFMCKSRFKYLIQILLPVVEDDGRGWELFRWSAAINRRSKRNEPMDTGADGVTSIVDHTLGAGTTG